jgi:hypothetical protein
LQSFEGSSANGAMVEKEKPTDGGRLLSGIYPITAELTAHAVSDDILRSLDIVA